MSGLWCVGDGLRRCCAHHAPIVRGQIGLTTKMRSAVRFARCGRKWIEIARTDLENGVRYVGKHAFGFPQRRAVATQRRNTAILNRAFFIPTCSLEAPLSLLLFGCWFVLLGLFSVLLQSGASIRPLDRPGVV